MRKPEAVFVVACVAVAVWTACVGDSPTSSNPPDKGAEGQACFEDKTCRSTLECRDGICHLGASNVDGSTGTSGGTTSSSSGSTSSGGTTSSSGTSGAPAVCTGELPTVGAGPKCPPTTDACKQNETCCVSQAAPTGNPICAPTTPGRSPPDACLSGVPFAECATDIHCGVTNRCCLEANKVKDCTYYLKATRCRPECGAGEIELCSKDNTICTGGGTCRPITLQSLAGDGQGAACLP